MKTIMNRERFTDALEHVGELFSKPYSITPIFDRWFNQLSMIHFENGKVLPISNKNGMDFVDIHVDGVIVPKEKIQLVMAFHSKSSTHDTDLNALRKAVTELKTKLETLKDESKPTQDCERELALKEKEINAFLADQSEARSWYDKIVERGKSSLNIKRLEDMVGSPVINIIHRPNHGIAHSVRAAYSIPQLLSFNAGHGKDFNPRLDDKDVEKLQMMMLFSVVGRQDETGFADTGNNVQGNHVYKKFRISSGRAYLNYFTKHLEGLYDKAVTDDPLKALYRDAIIVELMGYRNFDDVMKRCSEPPQLFIDYLMKIYDCTEEKARQKISTGEESLRNLFSSDKDIKQFNSKLKMMNGAHALELTRCYPLFKNKPGGPQISSTFNEYLATAGFFDCATADRESKLDSVFNLIRCSFDAMVLTGQRTTFDLLSKQNYELNKATILAELKAIDSQFSDPTQKDVLLAAAEANREKINGLWSDVADKDLISYYRYYLLFEKVVESLTVKQGLKENKRMFDFHKPLTGNPQETDNHQSAISLVSALQTIETYPGVDALKLPVIQRVTHDAEHGLVALHFDTAEEAEEYISVCKQHFKEFSETAVAENGQYVIRMNRDQYLALKKERQVEYKLATVPAKVEREAFLVDPEGNLDVLELIKDSRALGRVLSSNGLKTATKPDYEYFFGALDDPIHGRYSPEYRKAWAVDRGRYYLPSDGTEIRREVETSSTTELRFQEPILEPGDFHRKLADGWRVQADRGTDKNTIYIKKAAHSLIPPDGKMPAFDGVEYVAAGYFGIGVLSDSSQVDLKSERYIWSTNMNTFRKYWLRDSQVLNKEIFNLLHASMDASKPKRDSAGVVTFDKKSFADCKDYIALAERVEQIAEDLNKRLDKKFYRPSDEVLKDFKDLIAQQKEVVKKLKYPTDIPEDERLLIADRIKTAYKRISDVLALESQRKHPKYAISLADLAKQQSERTQDGGHNEMLIANTKSATRALYSSKDELFYRLNLAYHAKKIKEEHGYDVPLLVMNKDKPPYRYTEAMIESDLREAYERLQADNFPYDMTQYQIYKKDSKGDVAEDAEGHPIPELDEHQQPVTRTKDKIYQETLLCDLFKLGIPGLRNLAELQSGQVDGVPIVLDSAVSGILRQMDSLGGLQRETRLMSTIFATDDMDKKNQFFIRATALGLESLVKDMMARSDYQINRALLDKAIQVAEKNSQAPLVTLFSELRAKIEALNTSIQALDAISEGETPKDIRLNQLRAAIKVHQEYTSLAKTIDCPELKTAMNQHILRLMPTAGMNVETHQQSVLNLFSTLSAIGNEGYLDKYMDLLVSDKGVDASVLFKIYDQLGVQGVDHFDRFSNINKKNGPTVFDNALKLFVIGGGIALDLYLELLDHNAVIAADVYLKSVLGLSKTGIDPIDLSDLLKIKDQLGAQGFQHLDKLLEIKKGYDSTHFDNALKLFAKGGLSAVDLYLNLLDQQAKKAAKIYFEHVSGIKENLAVDWYIQQSEKPTHDSLKAQCLGLIQDIKAQSWGPGDIKTKQWCEKIEGLVTSKECGLFSLCKHIQQIQKVHAAVTSPEAMAVRGEVERKAEGCLPSSKAELVIKAVCEVELEDRLHLFTNERNAKCNQVRVELAKPLYSWRSYLNKDGTVDQFAASKAFKNVQAKIALSRSSASTSISEEPETISRSAGRTFKKAVQDMRSDAPTPSQKPPELGPK